MKTKNCILRLEILRRKKIACGGVVNVRQSVQRLIKKIERRVN